MAISLYDISVGSYLQILGGVSGVMDKGKASGIDLGKVVEARLIDSMQPFSFQVISTAHHSLGAIEGLRAGVFSPRSPNDGLDYDGLHGLIQAAIEGLGKVSADEVNALEGGDMRFEFDDFKVPFTAEGFIQSFSLPNFYFHATTTYDILRSKGVDLGKMDFMGAIRVKS